MQPGPVVSNTFKPLLNEKGKAVFTKIKFYISRRKCFITFLNKKFNQETST